MCLIIRLHYLCVCATLSLERFCFSLKFYLFYAWVLCYRCLGTMWVSKLGTSFIQLWEVAKQSL